MRRSTRLGDLTIEVPPAFRPPGSPAPDVLDTLLTSLPGASTIDDLFHAQHPVDTVEDSRRRRLEKVGALLLAGLFGPPVGLPWRVTGSAAPCEPGTHLWQDLGVFHPMIRNFVLSRVRSEHKLGAKLCSRCWHAFLPSPTNPEAP